MLREKSKERRLMQWRTAIGTVMMVLSVFTGVVWAQAFTVDITVAETNGTPKILQFGIAAGATDEVDAGQGEVELPPLPPSGNFDARFTTPLGRDLLKDIRDNAVSSHIFVLKVQRAMARDVAKPNPYT